MQRNNDSYNSFESAENKKLRWIKKIFNIILRKRIKVIGFLRIFLNSLRVVNFLGLKFWRVTRDNQNSN